MTSMVIIDPRVKFVGSSYLRGLNTEALRALAGALVVQDAEAEPLVVIVPYETYLKLQGGREGRVNTTVPYTQVSHSIFGAGSVESTQTPRARRLSKKAQAAEARKAADPVAQNLGRDDIDYMNPDELPSAGSVGMNPSVGGQVLETTLHRDGTNTHRHITDWREKRTARGPLLKQKDRK